MWRCLALSLVVACGPPIRSNDRDAATTGDDDAATHDDGGGSGGDDGGGSNTDGGGGGNDGGGGSDGGGGTDAGMATADAMIPPGVITGGPCVSGAAGATAYRIRWTNGGGTATVAYEVNGLPDKTPDHTGAYGYQIGFTPSYVDPYLAQGGLQLDGSDFVDIDLSTEGVTSKLFS